MREFSCAMKEYGDLMHFLLYFRDDYKSEEEFRSFALKEIRAFIYDLRDFGIEISLSHHSTKAIGSPVNPRSDEW